MEASFIQIFGPLLILSLSHSVHKTMSLCVYEKVINTVYKFRIFLNHRQSLPKFMLSFT